MLRWGAQKPAGPQAKVWLWTGPPVLPSTPLRRVSSTCASLWFNSEGAARDGGCCHCPKLRGGWRGQRTCRARLPPGHRRSLARVQGGRAWHGAARQAFWGLELRCSDTGSTAWGRGLASGGCCWSPGPHLSLRPGWTGGPFWWTLEENSKFFFHLQVEKDQTVTKINNFSIAVRRPRRGLAGAGAGPGSSAGQAVSSEAAQPGRAAHASAQRKKLLLFCWSGVILTPWLLPWGLLPSNFLSIFALMSLARVKNAFSTLMLALALVSMNLIP